MSSQSNAYRMAQEAMTYLKAAVYDVLTEAPTDGLTNAQIGRSLGIYMGHVGHQGHISRTVLGLMQAEEVVAQDPTSRRWRIQVHSSQVDDAD